LSHQERQVGKLVNAKTQVETKPIVLFSEGGVEIRVEGSGFDGCDQIEYWKVVKHHDGNGILAHMIKSKNDPNKKVEGGEEEEKEWKGRGEDGSDKFVCVAHEVVAVYISDSSIKQAKIIYESQHEL